MSAIRGYCKNGHKLSERSRGFMCPQCARNATRRENYARTVTIKRAHLEMLLKAASIYAGMFSYNGGLGARIHRARNAARRALKVFP